MFATLKNKANNFIVKHNQIFVLIILICLATCIILVNPLNIFDECEPELQILTKTIVPTVVLIICGNIFITVFQNCFKIKRFSDKNNHFAILSFLTSVFITVHMTWAISTNFVRKWNKIFKFEEEDKKKRNLRKIKT